jgi:hypothetical protein
MFGLFKKDPSKELQRQYAAKLEEARDAQRSGDIKGYARLMEESEEILKKIDKLREKADQ